jgi:outer membrane protein assembly factor BamB
MDADRVYLPLETNHVVALSRANGAEIWTSQDAMATSSPPIAAGGSVFVVSSGAIYEMDPATGKTRRKMPLPGRPTGPMSLARSLLLVPIEPDQLIAIRISDGQVAWTTDMGAPARVPAAIDTGRSVAYLALSDGRLAAHALDMGQRLWIETIGGVLGAPLLARDHVLVASSDHTLYARHAATGREAWHWATGGDILGMVATGETVYLVSLDNTVLALNRGSGNQRWLTPLTTRPVAPPRLVGRQVLVAGVGPVLAGFDATTGVAGATFVLEGDLETAALDRPLLVAPDARDASDAGVILIMRDGRVLGLRAGGQ